MSLLLFALVVVLCVAVACWIVQLIPFPDAAPAQLKPILMAVLAVIGLVLILMRVPGLGV